MGKKKKKNELFVSNLFKATSISCTIIDSAVDPTGVGATFLKRLTYYLLESTTVMFNGRLRLYADDSTTVFYLFGFCCYFQADIAI